MTTEIVKAQPATPSARPGGALSLGHMAPHDAWKFAEALSGSTLLPRQYQGQPASVLWALEYGRAVGLDVITTIQSVHVIQGRATASADLMASLTRRAGHRMRITGDDQRAEVVIIRADDPGFEFRAVWDTAKAQRAGLVKKDTWQQYPGSMLRARAISECVRMACPEVLHGSIYTPEEIGARVDADGVPIDAEVQQLRPVQAPPVEQTQTAAQGRDYLHEAREAQDAATVRRIWQEAKADSAVPEYLDQIATMGREKAAAEQPPDSNVEHPGEDNVIPEPDGDEHAADAARAQIAMRQATQPTTSADQEAAAAERELREFAARVGLSDIARDFETAKGLPLDIAGAAEIHGFLAELSGTAA